MSFLLRDFAHFIHEFESLLEVIELVRLLNMVAVHHLPSLDLLQVFLDLLAFEGGDVPLAGDTLLFRKFLRTHIDLQSRAGNRFASRGPPASPAPLLILVSQYSRIVL